MQHHYSTPACSGEHSDRFAPTGFSKRQWLNLKIQGLVFSAGGHPERSRSSGGAKDLVPQSLSGMRFFAPLVNERASKRRRNAERFNLGDHLLSVKIDPHRCDVL
jgi:hypothetical protein